MTGTLVNAALILVGGSVGLLAKRGISPRLEKAVHQATGLAVFVIGMNGVITSMIRADPATGELHSSGELVLVFSMILGALAGELLGIQEHLDQLGGWVENTLHLSGFAQSFVNGTLIYCVGAMAIVGSINDGLLGNPGILITKGVLDGITSIVLAATMGPGVIFSALPVLVYQGGLSLCASWLSPVLQGELLEQICAAGYVMVACIGVNFLGDGRFQIKVANLLPGLLVPAVWQALRVLAGGVASMAR